MEGFVVRTRVTHVPTVRWWFRTLLVAFWCTDAALQAVVVRLLPRWLAVGLLVSAVALLGNQVRVLLAGRTVEQVERAER